MADKSNDELVLSTLLDIREDLGGIQANMRQLHDGMSKNDKDHSAIGAEVDKLASIISVIPGSLDKGMREIESRLDAKILRVESDVGNKFNRMEQDLGSRIGRLETDARGMRETDLPNLREQMVIHKWLSSGRNKVLVLIGVAILGAAGNALAGLIKDNVKVTVDRSVNATVTTARPLDPLTPPPLDLDTMSNDTTPVQ